MRATSSWGLRGSSGGEEKLKKDAFISCIFRRSLYTKSMANPNNPAPAPIVVEYMGSFAIQAPGSGRYMVGYFRETATTFRLPNWGKWTNRRPRTFKTRSGADRALAQIIPAMDQVWKPGQAPA